MTGKSGSNPIGKENVFYKIPNYLTKQLFLLCWINILTVEQIILSDKKHREKL